MERFIPVECFRKKGNTFRGISFSRFDRNAVQYHLSKHSHRNFHSNGKRSRSLKCQPSPAKGAERVWARRRLTLFRRRIR